MEANRVPHKDIVAALERAVADHDWNRQAAVRLLVEHGYWPRRLQFLDHVSVERNHAGQLVAWVDFDELTAVADGSRASSSERAVLRLACHLAGHLPERLQGEWGWTLAGIVSPLDRTNGRLAIDAFAYAATGRTA